jgi:ABC-type sugar transport system ATPase subunit
MSPSLEVRGLSFAREAQGVLRELSFAAQGGELLVLAGPSGGGKSTLLRLIAGLLEPDAGEIHLDGRRLDTRPPRERPIAMVFQHHALFPHLNVLENLCFGLRARGMKRAEAEGRARRAAEALDIAALLSRAPRELSGGERQRVALGRALLREPRLFLMDEPLSSLDAPLRARLRSEILGLHRRLGATTVYVTHDQSEALSLADRLGILHEGRVVQLDRPEAIYRAPASLFVARFLGNPAMNLLDADAVPGAGGGAGVVLGIRPEHVGLAGSRWAPGPVPAQTFSARITHREWCGDQQFLTLDCAGGPLVARAEPEWGGAPGDTLQAWLPPEHLHRFDRASGARLPG